MAQTDNLIGLQINNFVIRRYLARGGMADVYVAENVRLQREVVLKVLLPALVDNQPWWSASGARRCRWPGCNTPTSSRSTTPATRPTAGHSSPCNTCAAAQDVYKRQTGSTPRRAGRAATSAAPITAK